MSTDPTKNVKSNSPLDPPSFGMTNAIFGTDK